MGYYYRITADWLTHCTCCCGYVLYVFDYHKELKMIVGTQIIADRPTIRGNIYPREVLDKVIEDFNIEAKHKKIKGSILNRTHIEKNGEYTHYVKSLFINDSGVL